MSFTISTDIFCDGDGCSAWTEGTTGIRTQVRKAKQIAARRGWKISTRRDLCPSCAQKKTTR